jgi:hypothetical protein
MYGPVETIFGKTFKEIVLDEDRDFFIVEEKSTPHKYDVSVHTVVYKHVPTNTFLETTYYESEGYGILDGAGLFWEVWPKEVMKTIYTTTRPF